MWRGTDTHRRLWPVYILHWLRLVWNVIMTFVECNLLHICVFVLLSKILCVIIGLFNYWFVRVWYWHKGNSCSYLVGWICAHIWRNNLDYLVQIEYFVQPCDLQPSLLQVNNFLLYFYTIFWNQMIHFYSNNATQLYQLTSCSSHVAHYIRYCDCRLLWNHFTPCIGLAWWNLFLHLFKLLCLHFIVLLSITVNNFQHR